jgi:hypothetical protein
MGTVYPTQSRNESEIHKLVTIYIKNRYELIKRNKTNTFRSN